MKDSEIIINKSKAYLLYYFREIFGIRRYDRLINTYLFLNGEPKLCFMYRFKGDPQFMNYEKKIEETAGYNYTIDVSTDKVVYVFDVPEDLATVIEIFMSGRYSNLPEKEELITFLKEHYGLTELSKTIRVLRKDPDLKFEIEQSLGSKLGDLDLASVPDLEKENLLYEENGKTEEYDDIGQIGDIFDKFDTQWDSQSPELPN